MANQKRNTSGTAGILRRRRFSFALISIFSLFAAILLTACRGGDSDKADGLNRTAYEFHYRNLDSTLYYANRALLAADGDDGVKAEAYNHKAFVSIARMMYDLAARQLDTVRAVTNNQVELLVADVQQMRLCQRMSLNKDFYTYRESAIGRLKRIAEEPSLSKHLQQRMAYARSELNIVTSTYYYYVGLEQQAVNAIEAIDPYGEILDDEAQLLNYLYNVGAGGSITQGTQEEINQAEMEYLIRCYNIAQEYNYPFWMANSLQAMSEHLQVPILGQKLINDNYAVIRSLNIDNMPDSLLAGNFAQRSLDIFHQYGDVYQTAGSYRTLAQCYWYIGDYEQSLKCLNEALYNDTAIFRAPDLVASIQEQLSVTYAALNNKVESHRNRNHYIETQDRTRQDLYLQSRADQLHKAVGQLNGMLAAIVVLMLLGIALLFLFAYLRRREARRNPIGALLKPLEQWKKEKEQHVALLNEQHEETVEKMAVAVRHIENNKRLNLEQRAKVSLVNMVTPYIDRILHEIRRLETGGEDQQLREERYAYVAELTDRIIDYNDILTQWIQLRKGELSLHIESFPLQPLFDIVAHSRRGFQMKGITLDIQPTSQWVKADRILTLFMVNTMADNARKFTEAGGTVKVFAHDGGTFVEVSVADTGRGMTEQQMGEVFSVEKKAFNEDNAANDGRQRTNAATGHGFGLVNCKGIIEKYKKMSSLFSVCDIGVESRVGEGSRFFFRLPKGMVRTLAILMTSIAATMNAGATPLDSISRKATMFADSVYQCNIEDRNQEALACADSAIRLFNNAYRIVKPNGRDTLVMQSNKSLQQADIQWFHEGLNFDFNAIKSMRNEIAVAALALHEWAIYRYNNKVYTLLSKEMSADRDIEETCRIMQKSQSNKYMAIVVLVILFLLILLAYLLLYYRHQIYYRFCLERVRAMNDALTSEGSDEWKLAEIERLAGYAGDSAKVRVEGRKKTFYDDERLPSQLQNIADQLIQSLKTSIDTDKRIMTDIDLAEDEVRRYQMEDDKLHVCNSVLDNCLSTLKHETMYFPSRIRALLDQGDNQLKAIGELADYYKELYALLSTQAMRQLDNVAAVCQPVRIGELLRQFEGHPLADVTILGDKQMLAYLFELLNKQGGKEKPLITIEEKDGRYISFRVNYRNFSYNDEQLHDLFNPAMNHLPFFLCRQIVRDVGENTNARGCGIRAEKDEQGHTVVIVDLVKARSMKQEKILQ